MRHDERYSAIKLQKYLISRGHKANFKDGPDPPDIEFEVDQKRWAVEHTQLFQYVDQKGIAESRNRIDTINLNFEQRLLSSTEGNRKSSWILVLYGISDSKMRKKIELSSTMCIQTDSTDSFSGIPQKVAELIKLPDSEGRITVFSALPSSSKVPNSNTFTADIQATIDYAVQKIFEKKAYVLMQFTRYDSRVLLIQGRYFFLNTRNMSIAIAKHHSLRKGVNKIFLVTNKGVGEIN